MRTIRMKYAVVDGLDSDHSQISNEHLLVRQAEPVRRGSRSPVESGEFPSRITEGSTRHRRRWLSTRPDRAEAGGNVLICCSQRQADIVIDL
jgi:hypothetical protein